MSILHKSYISACLWMLRGNKSRMTVFIQWNVLARLLMKFNDLFKTINITLNMVINGSSVGITVCYFQEINDTRFSPKLYNFLEN